MYERIYEDFVISLHDAENGGEKDFDEWQQYYKQNNCRTFNRKQACIIAAYLDEINNKLVEAGGDKLDKWYWTDTSCNDYACAIAYACAVFLPEGGPRYGFPTSVDLCTCRRVRQLQQGG